MLAEALNFIRKKVRRQETAEALMALVFGAPDAAPMVATVIRIHGGRFARALDRYRHEFDRGLSLTAWTNVVAMQETDVAQVATFEARLAGVVPATPME